MIKLLVIAGILFLIVAVFFRKRAAKQQFINTLYDRKIELEPQKSDFYNIQRETELNHKEEANKYLKRYLTGQIDNFINTRGSNDGS